MTATLRSAATLLALSATLAACGAVKTQHRDERTHGAPEAPQPQPQPQPQPTGERGPNYRSVATPGPRAVPAVAQLTEADLLPPAFDVAEGRVVPVDLERIDATLTADVSAKRIRGEATLVFRATADGLPLLDLIPDADALTLDGASLDKAALKRVDLPEGAGKARALVSSVKAGEPHTLTIGYTLTDLSVKFSETGLGFGLFMSDLELGGDHFRHYLEAYVPANLEFDRFDLTVTLALKNATKAHKVFTNGTLDATRAGEGVWTARFPGYFTASSPYFHVTEQDVVVRESVFAGKEKAVPVTIYGTDAALLEKAEKRALETLTELERDYGAYAHASLTAYVTEEFPGGMEYCGATITNLMALSHELSHSWFARGVMPANGNAGWIDEAIASWRDFSYSQSTLQALHERGELAAGPAHRRDTPTAAYFTGETFLGVLDKEFTLQNVGGLKGHLAALYAAKRNDRITTPYFQAFLEERTGLDLQDLFAAYAYEKNPAKPSRAMSLLSAHPLPPTSADLRGAL